MLFGYFGLFWCVLASFGVVWPRPTQVVCKATVLVLQCMFFNVFVGGSFSSRGHVKMV